MYNYELMVILNKRLLEANRAYYSLGHSIMSDKEYDRLYDLLVKWEKETNIIVPGSVTQQVGHPVVSSLEKEVHEQKALSLNKTKDVHTLVAWTKGQDTVLSWKLDGLTIVLTYDRGYLVKAVTRGNGSIGENITHNAPYIHGIPMSIPCKDHLVVRGEALVSYANMDKINASLKPGEQPYTLARSLASGSVRKLNSAEMADRGIEFKAFELVSAAKPTFKENLDWLHQLGFAVVPHVLCPSADLQKYVMAKEKSIAQYPYPVDGLVVMINDLAYAKTLGTTEKYPNWGMAFKWQDATYPSTVRNIAWQASRTGRINPVVEFDTVEIDGSNVSRATGNNLSFLADKGIGVGSVVEVYKANMIIPTIDRVVSNPQPLSYPAACPSCGGATSVRTGKDGSKILYCENPSCPAKQVEHFVHFVGDKGMDIKGLAKNTLVKLIDSGLVKTYPDIYNLYTHMDTLEAEIGKKSAANLIAAIDESRKSGLQKILCSVGIPNLGSHASRDIASAFEGDFFWFMQGVLNGYDFRQIEGIGDVIHNNIHQWFSNPDNYLLFMGISMAMDENYIRHSCDDKGNIIPPKGYEKTQKQGHTLGALAGKTFVVTGKVTQFANRKALTAWIEDHGGKTAGSVSKNTDFLINNDNTSMSGKNKKAKELGVPVITEAQLLAMAG